MEATKSAASSVRVLSEVSRPNLILNFKPAHAAEIVFARIEEHAVKQGRGGLQRRRIAGAELAIDFDQRLARRANGVLIERAGKHHAHVVAVGEEHVHAGDAGIAERRPDLRGQRLVGFEQHFAGLPVHQIRDRVGALEIRNALRARRAPWPYQFLVQRFRDALVRADQHFVALRILDLMRQLAVDQPFGKIPVQLAVAQRDALDLVEGAKNFLVGLHAQGAQENRPEELALAVDADVENVLRVVLEFTHEPR